MEKSWHEEFLGRPWEGVPHPPASFTCGELIRYVYKRDFGHNTLPVPVPDARDLKASLRAMEDGGGKGPRYFDLVPAAEPLRDKDTVVMKRRSFADHCGLLVLPPSGGRYVLHCSQRGGVQLSSFAELKAQGFTGFEFWRVPDGGGDED